MSLFDAHAEAYAAKYADITLFQPALDQFCQALPTTRHRLLDIACGPGQLSRYVLTQCPEGQLMGIDLAPNMLACAQRILPAAEFRQLDCREIGRQFEPGFAGIICGFVLPYLLPSEAEQLINDMAALLLPGGILYLSTMEDSRHSEKWQTSSSGEGPSLRSSYYTADQLTAWFAQENLEVLYLERIEQPYQRGTTENDLVLVARKQQG